MPAEHKLLIKKANFDNFVKQTGIFYLGSLRSQKHV